LSTGRLFHFHPLDAVDIVIVEIPLFAVAMLAVRVVFDIDRVIRIVLFPKAALDRTPALAIGIVHTAILIPASRTASPAAARAQ